MKYQAILWDLDGTLLDTLQDLTDSVNFALARCGYPPRTDTEVRAFVGSGIRNLMSKAVPGGAEDPKLDQSLELFRTHYSEHNAEKTCPYGGMKEILLALREKGIRSAVVSNKFDPAVRKLVEYYFDDLICLSVGEQEGLAKKPASDMIDFALSRLGVDKKDAVYIGDSEVDVRTVKNAGMDGIFVTWGFRDADVLRNEGGECIVSDKETLFSLLTKES